MNAIHKKTWECSSCDKLFKTRDYLWTHYRSMHQFWWYHYCSVDTCRKGIAGSIYGNDEQWMVFKHEVDFHKIPHPDITCKKCNGSFGQRAKLKLHKIKCGTKEKPFKCNIGDCKVEYRKQEQLTNHKNQVHLNKGYYNCVKCKKQLKSYTGWWLHMKRHAELESESQNVPSTTGAPPRKRKKKDKK